MEIPSQYMEVERHLFENWCDDSELPIERRGSGEYFSEIVQMHWRGWKARAGVHYGMQLEEKRKSRIELSSARKKGNPAMKPTTTESPPAAPKAPDAR